MPLILDLPFGGGFMSALNLPLTVNFPFSLPVRFDTGASSWAQCSCFPFHAAGKKSLHHHQMWQSSIFGISNIAVLKNCLISLGQRRTISGKK
jgi:hypothetical protein